MNDSILMKFEEDPELTSLELLLRRPNIFSILRINEYEIRHSNFLAWLLDPNEGHNLSEAFLRSFIKNIYSDSKAGIVPEHETEKWNLAETVVLREWKNIDILVIHPRFVICIENKINTGEHSQQLKKYRATVQSEYPSLPKTFVLLSPDSIEPEDHDDASQFITFTYRDINNILETLLSACGNSIHPKVKYYIEDYLEVVQMDILKEGKMVDLARQIYQKHSEALDFIYENIPDRRSEIGPIIENIIKSNGYIPGSSGKGYNRFLTPQLFDIMPQTGYVWKNKEAFLFEIKYVDDRLKFQAVIEPGDSSMADLLEEAILDIPGAKQSSGRKWRVYFTDTRKIDVTSEEYSDESQLSNKVNALLSDNLKIIRLVEDAIMRGLG